MNSNIKKKIAFITTHPIQYYSPIYRSLTESSNYEIKVFYTWGVESIAKYEPEFNKVVEWDIPLLDGYAFEFCNNIAKEKGSHHYNGIYAIDLDQKIEDYNPDLVCIVGWNYKSHLDFINKYSGKFKIALRGDSHLLDNTNFIKQLVKNFYIRNVFNKINYFFYVGTNNKAYFKHYGVAENQLFYINHSIENERFSNINLVEIEQLKLHYGINKEDHVLIYVGKLEKKKGIKLLIEAFSNLNQSRFKLIIIGDGDERHLLSKTKNKNIIHLGFINQMALPNYYKLADVLVLPSIGPNETWGLVINEAMVNGLAIIATDKVGSAEDLINGNGFVVQSNDVSSLEHAMNNIFNSNLNNYKSKSLEIIEHHTLEKSIERYINAFNKILIEKNNS